MDLTTIPEGLNYSTIWARPPSMLTATRENWSLKGNPDWTKKLWLKNTSNIWKTPEVISNCQKKCSKRNTATKRIWNNISHSNLSPLFGGIFMGTRRDGSNQQWIWINSSSKSSQNPHQESKKRKEETELSRDKTQPQLIRKKFHNHQTHQLMHHEPTSL